MNYVKPSIVVAASAAIAIKGTGKGDDLQTDSRNFITESAYEADE
jgi:hypothetical protein